MPPQMGLVLSSIAFVGTHFLLSHPLRRPLVRTMGERPFQGLYSLVSLITFGLMIYFYRVIGREPVECCFWPPTVWRLAASGRRVIGAVKLDEAACRVLHDLSAGDEVG